MTNKAQLHAVCAALILIASIKAGTITGSVSYPDGKAVAGVPVRCAGLNIAVPPSTPRNRLPIPPATAATTDATGYFSCTGLPAGTYYVCAFPAVSGQISSCEHGIASATTSIGGNETNGGMQLTMELGDIIKVHVNDAVGKLASGAPLAISFIATNGTYHRATPMGKSGQVFHHELTIPKNQSSWLVLNTLLQVQDAQGAALPTGKKSITLSGPTEFTISVK